MSETVSPETRSMHPSDWVLLAVPGIIWGSSFYFIAIAMDSFSPGLVTPLRVLIGFMTLGMFPKARAPIPRRAWGGIVTLGIVWLAVPLSAFPFAEQHVSSSVIGMLNGASPLFTALVATAIVRKAPPSKQVLGLGIGLLGVVCIALPSIIGPSTNNGSSSTFGVVLVLSALTLYGVALNVAGPLQREYGALPVLWRAQFVAVVLLSPMGIYSLRNSEFAWRPFMAIIVLGVFGTALAQLAMATLAGRIGATRAAAGLYLMPAVALFLGVTLRHENVAALAIFGSVIAVLGAYVLGRSKRDDESAVRTGNAPLVQSEVALRPAATVMLIRDIDAGSIDVFMLQRTHSAAFARGMYVFPGGRVDDVDSAQDLEDLCDGMTDVEASALLHLPSGGLSYWVAAIRECFEEAGVLLARNIESGEVVRFDSADVAARYAIARQQIYDGTLTLVELCRRENLHMITDSIHYVSHWITPIGESRRFDTRFFVACAPPAQQPLHDDGETIASLWVEPNDALARNRRNELAMIQPTISNLEFLAPYSSTSEVLLAATKMGMPPAILPKLRTNSNGKVIGVLLPGQPGYEAAI